MTKNVWAMGLVLAAAAGLSVSARAEEKTAKEARPIAFDGADALAAWTVTGDVAIDKAATYTVTVNNFLAAGGDNFEVFTLGADQVIGPVDLDALITYISSLAQPFNAAIEGRIARLD